MRRDFSRGVNFGSAGFCSPVTSTYRLENNTRGSPSQEGEQGKGGGGGGLEQNAL